MNVDQRLHHAARELRAVDVAIPPLPVTSSHHRPRVTTVLAAVALLTTLTGASIGLLRAEGSTSPAATAAAVTTAESANAEEPTVAVESTMLSPREEIAIIERLGAASSSDSDTPSRQSLRGVI